MPLVTFFPGANKFKIKSISKAKVGRPKNWTFQVELINVTKEENPKLTYPAIVRREGIPPSQYGTKSLLGERFADIEEKYDLTKGAEGFGEEGEETNGNSDDTAGEEHPNDEENY